MIAPDQELPDAADIDQRIDAVYGSLSPQLKRAARYLSDHPDDIAVHSMRHVARSANVPPSTMTRLAHALEFDGYESLRDEYRSRITNEGRFAKRAVELQSTRASSGDGDGFLHAHVREAVENVEACLDHVSERELQDTAQLLLSCDRVMVAAVLSSFSLATYTHYVASMALPRWSLITSEGDSFANQLTQLTPNDALLVISYAPYGRLTLEAAAHARQRGCRIIAISDSRLSPLADLADRLLICRTSTHHFFPSGVAVITLLEALIGACIAAAGDSAVHRLSDVEQLRRQFGDYWTEGSRIQK